MKNKRFDEKTQMIDLIYNLSEGNQGAVIVVVDMLANFQYEELRICDDFDIVGDKLYKLYNDCCQRNYNKVSRTLEMIEDGIFPAEYVKANLALPRSVEFLNDFVLKDEVPAYEEKFDKSHKMYNAYCAEQKGRFKTRLDSAAENFVREC